MSVHVEHSEPGRLQTLDDHRDEAAHQLVAQHPVLVGLAAQTGGVEGDRMDVPIARASKSTRKGGTSHDQPSRSPSSIVSIVSAPRSGTKVSSATRP